MITLILNFVKEFMNITTTNSFLLLFYVFQFLNISIIQLLNFFQESDVSSRNNLFSCISIISNFYLFDRTKSRGDYLTEN